MKTLINTNIQVTDETSAGLVLKCYGGETAPTTPGTFAPGAEYINTATGVTFRNGGTTASPSWQNTDEITSSEIATGAVTSAKIQDSVTLVTPILGVAAATSVKTANGSAAAPAFSFTGDADTGIYTSGANLISFASDGSFVGRISAADGLEISKINNSPIGATVAQTGRFTTLETTAGGTLRSGLVIPATAGAVAAGVPITYYSTSLTVEVTSDAPTHTRPKGSICINSGGSSTTTRMYVNTDGAGTWTPFTTGA